MLSTLYSASELNKEEKDYWYLRFFDTNNGCNLNCSDCKFCQKKWCYRHGQYQRIELCNAKIEQLDHSKQYHCCVLNFGEFFNSKRIMTAFKRFKRMCKENGLNIVDWTIHFKYFIAHINLTILCSTIKHGDHMKQYWTDCLNFIQHTSPNKPRTYFVPCKNLIKWTNYIYRTKQIIPARECPPKHKEFRFDFCMRRCNPKKKG